MQFIIRVSSMATFFKAYHQLGMKQPILGSFNLSVPRYLEVIPGLLEGVTFIDAFDPDKKEAKAFIYKYKKEYGKVPFALPAYGYDGLHVIVNAIQRARCNSYRARSNEGLCRRIGSERYVGGLF